MFLFAIGCGFYVLIEPPNTKQVSGLWPIVGPTWEDHRPPERARRERGFGEWFLDDDKLSYGYGSNFILLLIVLKKKWHLSYLPQIKW